MEVLIFYNYYIYVFVKALKHLDKYFKDREELDDGNELYPRKYWHLVYGPSYLLRLIGLYKHII